MRIALVHGNDGSDVRVGKTCRSLARLGFDTHFVGWDRRPGAEKEIDLDGASAHVMVYATPHGRGNLAGQARFLRHVISTLGKLRPQVVCAVNEELACAVLPLKGIYFDRLICDVYDSLGARAMFRPWHKRWPLQAVNAIGSLGADRLIATDERRQAMLGRYAGKAIVVENVPEDPGPELAANVPTGPIRVWAGGSLDARKGFGQLLEAIEPLDGVQVISAGWPYDDFAAQVFIRHPRVEFHGIVTARRALELAASCDAVFCYYAPINAYMIHASPNKVYDAMAVGRPVLINREVRLADWVERTGVGSTCAYTSVTCLRSAIAALAEQRGALDQFAARARALFLERYHWGVMETRLARLYGALDADQPR